MTGRAVRVTLIAAGVLAIVCGGVWIAQGLNLLPGSRMSGDLTWFYIGMVVAVAGAIALVLGLRRRPRSP